MSEAVKSPQRDRLNPQKPSVRKLRPGGMWWAEVIDSRGVYYCECCFTQTDALTKAYEFAAMNKESAK